MRSGRSPRTNPRASPAAKCATSSAATKKPARSTAPSQSSKKPDASSAPTPATAAADPPRSGDPKPPDARPRSQRTQRTRRRAPHGRETGPRPLRASGSHRSPARVRTARRLASPIQRPWRAITSESEAVSTRDAHHRAVSLPLFVAPSPDPLPPPEPTGPLANTSFPSYPLTASNHRPRCAPSRTCQRQPSPATAGRLHPGVNLRGVMRSCA